jgi:hypothetical protein
LPDRRWPAAQKGRRQEKKTDVHALLEEFIQSHKAGSPTDPDVYWVCLKPSDIATLFFEKHGTKVNVRTVKDALASLGYRYRKHSKQLPTGSYTKRDEQFRILIALVFMAKNNEKTPIISIDCKKKENIGNLYRDGRCYCTKALEVFDHDYPYLSRGRVVPHGIYDTKLNKGYVSVGNGSETAAFVRDNLLWWWEGYGRHQYPGAKSVLVLCDSGGANSYRHHVFKHEIQQFSNETGLAVKVCHYPPYSSKWNPIEHKLFCHMHRAMSGCVFDSYETVKKLIGNTSTKEGLTVVVRLNLKEYQRGVKIDKSELEKIRIYRHKKIPDLSYKIVPAAA